jgi:hypothetical protein
MAAWKRPLLHIGDDQLDAIFVEDGFETIHERDHIGRSEENGGHVIYKDRGLD